jgi:class 3 adenylate cyclase
MALADDIKSEVTNILRTNWKLRDGRDVPEDNTIILGNDGVNLDAVVLYADLVDSSGLVARESATFAAEIYKCYLSTACRIIRDNGGKITAFDGDRVMAVFVGDSKNSAAARAALKINKAIKEIVNPAIKVRYPGTAYSIDHVVGIDASKVLVAKTGIRGSNDLVWVGTAPNTAAKLCTIRGGFPSWVTSGIYAMLAADVKVSNGRQMWEARTWNGVTIYGSGWMYAV